MRQPRDRTPRPLVLPHVRQPALDGDHHRGARRTRETPKGQTLTPDDFLSAALEQAHEAREAGAPIRPAAAAAHAANESAWGASRLAVDARNLFGIKATGQHTPHWDGSYVTMQTWEVLGGQNVMIDAKFRRYESWAASFADYGDVIRRVYPRAASAPSDVAFLAGIFLGPGLRWATDPAAFSKVCTILAQHASILTPPDSEDGIHGIAHTLVLTNLSIADRWLALSRTPVMRGRFVWRVRGDRVDVRRE